MNPIPKPPVLQKKKSYFVAAKIEVDDFGNFSADVRRLAAPNDSQQMFDALGPLLWSERITSFLVKAFIDSKLKLFK